MQLQPAITDNYRRFIVVADVADEKVKVSPGDSSKTEPVLVSTFSILLVTVQLLDPLARLARMADPLLFQIQGQGRRRIRQFIKI